MPVETPVGEAAESLFSVGGRDYSSSARLRIGFTQLLGYRIA